MSKIIALVGKEGLPLIPNSNNNLRSFQPTATIHFQRYINGANGSAPVIQSDSTIILDARVFEGGGDDIPKMRDYLRHIREKYFDGPRILCLRLNIHDEGIARNDIKAGATATLFYLGNIPDATRRMNTFMETGTLPSPRTGRSSAVVSVIPSSGLFADSYENEATGDIRTDTKPSSSRPINVTPPSRHQTSIPTKPAPSSAPKNSGKSPKGKSPQATLAPPTSTEEPVLGDQDMEQLLVALKTLIGQNETLTGQNVQILTALQQIQGGLDGLRADREVTLLAQMREKVSAAMNTAFAQLQQGNHDVPAIAPASTDITVGSTPTSTAGVKDTPAPDAAREKKEPIALLTKHGWSGTVILFNKTIDLPYGSAELFTHLVNTGETMSTTDIATLYKLGKQGGYFRMSKLLEGLDAFRKGLSSCMMLVQSGNSKNYRFDIDAFRKAFGIK